MKKLAILVLGLLITGITANATTNTSPDSDGNNYYRYDGKTYIFEEGGVEFSVFADGQFDFAYVGQYNSEQVQVNVSTPNVNISFNAGHDYEMYVQYDDYGAVTQIENVPIYYDHYGRITQAGNVDIRYNDRRIVRVGGLHINYDHYGYYSGYTGFINVHNQFYVYRPWHVFYAPPIFASCIVYDYPYRRYYSPIRYSYSHHRSYYSNRHHVAYHNGRRDFHRPGSRNHYKNGRTARNKDYNPKRRNTMIAESGRRGNNVNKGRPVSNSQSVERGRPSATTKGRPSTSRPSVDRSRPSATTKGRPASNRPAVERSRPSSMSKGKPAKSRPSVDRSRPSSMSKGKPTTSRPSIDRSRPSSMTKGKPAKSRPSVERSRPSSISKGKQKSSSRPNVSKRVASNKQKSQNRTVKRSTGSNSSKARSSNTNTRSSNSKRGRGL